MIYVDLSGSRKGYPTTYRFGDAASSGGHPIKIIASTRDDTKSRNTLGMAPKSHSAPTVRGAMKYGFARAMERTRCNSRHLRAP